MTKYFIYSTFLHFILFLLLFISIKQFPTSNVNEQEVYIGFQHSISQNALNTLKQAKNEEDKQQNKLNKFLNEKQKTNSDQDLKNDLINNQEQLKADNSAIPIQNTQDETKKEEVVENKNSPTQPQDQDVLKPQIANPNSKTIEDSGLSSREKTNILSQLKMCYHHAIKTSKTISNANFIVEVEITKDGFIQSKIDSLIDKKKYLNSKNNEYKIMIDNIKKALELCSPLRNLPLEKYELWKNLILNFENE